jgi:site-specific DNA-methyltransferase (adenine-specific)
MSEAVATLQELGVPSELEIERLAEGRDLSDLAGKPVEILRYELDWHRGQAQKFHSMALAHWLEAGRRLIAIKGSLAHGEFTPWVADNGISQSAADGMMYLARNSQSVANLIETRPGMAVNAAITEIRHQVQIAKHATPPVVIPWVEKLPPNIEIEQGDAAAIALSDAMVDLIVTSPPYNLDRRYGESSDDALDYAEYLKSALAWSSEMERIAGPHGRLAINLPLDTMLGGTPRAVMCDWYALLLAVGWTYRSTIIWDEDNVSRSNARGSIGKPSSPYVAAPVEMILLMHKGAWKIERPGVEPDLTTEESVAWQGPAAGSWKFSGAHHAEHEAPFPEELPRRLIKMLSYPGDVVCDPFVGTGTTAVVAARLGRTCYGFDVNMRNVSIARERISKEVLGTRSNGAAVT